MAGIVSKQLVSGNNVNSYADVFVKIDMWLGNEEQTKQNTINTEAIQLFKLQQDIMSILPTAVIILRDNDNKFFSTLKLKIGDILSVKITPNSEKDKDDTKVKINSVLETKLTILKIVTTPSFKADESLIQLTCSYAALSIVTKNLPYQPSVFDSLAGDVLGGQTSLTVLTNYISRLGLKTISEVEYTKDLMKWINCNKKAKDFICKVVQHSWIAMDDAMLVYCDLEGVVHLTSVKTLVNKPEAYSATTEAASIGKEDDAKNYTYMFTDASFSEWTGITTLDKGYRTDVYVYDPTNATDGTTEIYGLSDVTEFKFAEATNLVDTATDVIKGTTCNNYRMITFDDIEPRLAEITSKLAFMADSDGRHADAGMHFMDTHMHYEVAPYHNQYIITSFFQNAIDIHMTINRQSSDSVKLPQIGEKIYVNFATTKNENLLYRGNYIIGAINYEIQRNGKLEATLTLLSDGFYKRPGALNNG